MGSFKFVYGTGYGRHELSSARDLRRQFDLLKNAARKASEAKPRIDAKKTTTTSTGMMSIYDKVWVVAVKKANKWARETAAAMRSSVPVDTGNLRGSIHVLEDECYRNKSTGEIIMVVGVDLDPAGGYNKLYPPPHRKHSKRYGRKTSPWKGFRIMPEYDPSYPEGYAAKFLGEGTTVVSQRFKAVAKRNAKKIFGK